MDISKEMEEYYKNNPDEPYAEKWEQDALEECEPLETFVVTRY